MRNKLLNTIYFIFLLILGFFIVGQTFSNDVYAYDGCGCASNGSYYCYNCDPCGSYCATPSPCDFCSSNCGACCHYVVWEVNSPKCVDDCTSGCNACANYSYLSTTNYGLGSKSVSCRDDCGDTDWDTCYCKYNCTPSSCPSGTSTTGSYGFYKKYTCTNQCGVSNSRSCYCTSACTPTSCPGGTSESGSHGLYNTYSCTNACGQSNSRSCYCDSSCTPASCPSGTSESGSFGLYQTNVCSNSCSETQTRDCYCTSQCTPTSCPAGTSEGGTHGEYDTYTCTNDCGIANSRTCYCDSSCTPPSCPAGTSETSDGEIYDATPVECTNSCDESQSRTCYCNTATCADLESELTWLDECPDGQTCRTTEQTIPIDPSAQGCPEEEKKFCHIDNARPQLVSFDIEPVEDEVLNFESNTHTGTELNNPLHMSMQYSDANGFGDIEALYVWWSTSATKDFVTPDKISDPSSELDGQTANNENFGFLVTRDNEDNWTNYYKPHIDEGINEWVKEDDPSSFTILGPDSNDPMISISSISIAEEGNDVTIDFNMEILLGPSNEEILNGTYHVWTLANDIVGFLPFDSSETIVDSADEFWIDSEATWDVDLEKPTLQENGEISISHIDENLINVTFAISDAESNLASVRLDACKSGNIANPLEVDGRSYTLASCDSIDWGSDNPDLNMGSDGVGLNNLLGETPLNPESDSYAVDGVSTELIIDLNGNSDGSISYYLTFMDEAGNWAQDMEIHRLGNWAITSDGLVYGADGVSSSTRPLISDDVWNPNLVLETRYDFTETTIDLTEQILLGGPSTMTSFLGYLTRMEENNSFKVSNFAGLYINNPYDELVAVFDNRKENIANLEEIYLTEDTVSGDLTTYCETNPDVCVLRREGETPLNLNISSDFECNSKGLIMVDGNLNINPDIVNTNNSDACIFVVGGDVNIQKGEDKDNSIVGINYDLLEAFVISSGDINIATDDQPNGLAVQGALVTLGTINNSRSIGLDYRNTHPVVAVKGNAKYGLLSRTLFGTQTDIFRVDIGFKPY